MTTPRAETASTAKRVAAFAVLASAWCAGGGVAGAQAPPTTVPTTTTSSTATTEPPGTVRLTPGHVDFGDVPLGEESHERLTVTAVDGPLHDVRIFVNWPFRGTTDCPDTLETNHSCTIDVPFAPTHVGPEDGNVQVQANGTEDPATTTLDGVGVRPTPTTVPATTAVPTTTPPTTTTVPETRDQCDARAREARIEYAPKVQMLVDESTSVQVTAAIGSSTTTTADTLPVSTTSVPQALRCQVRARLVGNDFDINPDEWDERSFQGVNEITWTWIVTPEVVGDDLPLVLVVQGLRFDSEAGTYIPAGEAFQTTAVISVDSQPKTFFTRVNTAVSGVVTHPVFALLASTGVLALVAGWLYRRFRARPDGPEDTV